MATALDPCARQAPVHVPASASAPAPNERSRSATIQGILSLPCTAFGTCIVTTKIANISASRLPVRTQGSPQDEAERGQVETDADGVRDEQMRRDPCRNVVPNE